MNLKVLKIFLILVLVCSLLFEVECEKRHKKRRKGRQHRRKNKNKKRITTTSSYPNTTDYIMMAGDWQNRTDSKTPEAATTISDDSLGLNSIISSTPKSKAGKHGMNSIMDMIFSPRKEPAMIHGVARNEPNIVNTTTMPDTYQGRSEEKCTSQLIRSKLASLIKSDKLQRGKLLPLWSEKASVNEKLNFINQTLIGVGLPPLPTCIVEEEAIQNFLVTTAETTTTVPVTESDVSKEDWSVVCDPAAIKAKIRSYAYQGKLSWFGLMRLQAGSYTKEQKRIKINEYLVQAGLPTVPACKQSKDTTVQSLATTAAMMPTTTTTTTTTAVALSVAPSATTKASDMNDLTKVQTVEKDNLCDPEIMKAKLREYAFQGRLSTSKLLSIRNGRFTEKQRMEKINETLIEARLPPLPSCNKVEKENTTQKNSVMTSTSTIASAKHLLTTNQIQGNANDDNDTGTSVETINDEDLCDPEIMKAKIIDYAMSGKLSISKLMSVNSGNFTMKQKTALINETLVEADLPPLPSCDDRRGAGVNKCALEINVTNTEEFFRTLRKMEDSRLVPVNTTRKAIAGEISHNELEKIIQRAAVKSGQIPESCINKTNEQLNPPKTLPIYKGSQNQQLNQLLAIIEAGYLPPDTLERYARGEITKQWLQANLSKNRDFILSQLPEPISILIKEGKMPPEIEAALFSGSHNKSEIMKMIVENDNVIKQLLPKQMQDIIQDRPIPMELKQLMLSGKNASEIKVAVQENEDILKQMMSPSSFFFYNLFKLKRNRDINTAMSVITMVALVFVMTSLGCTMTVPQIAEHAKRPRGVIIALFAQFIVMPASAYGLSQAFHLEMFAAISVLICGCCPGGNLSNMLAYAMRGDMNLSILMTTCSSVLGLGFMPLNIFLYSKLIVPLNGGDIVPFDKIVINIMITIIPVAIGIAIRHYRPQLVTGVMRLGGIMLLLSGITIAVLAGIMLGDAFFAFFPAPVLGCCAILPMAGYTLGYILAAIAGETPKCRRTICVETGCQNVQLCATVLKLAFDPIVVGVLFLMPLVYMLFQIIEAGLMVLFFRIYDRIRGHKELEEEEEDSEEKKKSDIESDSDEKDSIRKEENIKLLNLNQESDSSPQTELPEKKVDESDLAQTWPLQGDPAPGYLDSFKDAGTEKYA